MKQATKHTLYKELSAMILELNQPDITKLHINQLCNRAGVARNTFYAEYDGIEDVYDEVRCYLKSQYEIIDTTNIFEDKECFDMLMKFFRANRYYLGVLRFKTDINDEIYQIITETYLRKIGNCSMIGMSNTDTKTERQKKNVLRLMIQVMASILNIVVVDIMKYNDYHGNIDEYDKNVYKIICHKLINDHKVFVEIFKNSN